MNIRKKNSTVNKLPANFDRNDLSLFADDLRKEISNKKIVEFRDVKISAEGILFHKNRILPESFSDASSFKEWKKRAVIKTYLKNLIFRKSSQRGNVLWITDDWSEGYFHWLSDCLPKLVIAHKYLQKFSLLLPSKLKNLDFVSTSLDIFGVKNFEYINENETVLCNKIFLPFHTSISGDFNESVIKEVRRIFVEKIILKNDNLSQKVYISRKKANKRKILNEDEIIDILKKYDFQIVCAEDYPFLEQIKLFSSVKYLISIHGAGLTNMLFMSEGSKVMEFRKHDEDLTNCYFNISSALGLDYFYQLCESNNALEKPHTADLIVEKALLIKNLEKLLNHNN